MSDQHDFDGGPSVIDQAIDAVYPTPTASVPSPTTTTVTIDGATMTVEQALEALRSRAPDKPKVEEFNSDLPRVIEPVPIQLGHMIYHLRLPFWALRKFQQATGVSPWDHQKVWGWPPDMDTLVALTWAGLLDENPDITLEQVERLEGMDFANIHYLRKKLDECWGRNAASEDPGRNGGRSDPN